MCFFVFFVFFFKQKTAYEIVSGDWSSDVCSSDLLPAQARIPVLVGAGGTEKTFRWIARHADGWMSTPMIPDLETHIRRFQDIWREEGRLDVPRIVALGERPDPERLAHLESLGVTETIFGLPDRSAEEVEAWIGRLAGKLGLETTQGASRRPHPASMTPGVV